MENQIQKVKGGYTLVEILFYIALFSVLTLAIIDSFVTMTKAFKEISIQSDLVQSSLAIERMSREIRQAYGINSITTSDLKLNTKDELDNNETVRFLLSGSDIQLFENDVLTGNLNTPNIQVVNLSFTQITTVNGNAIKISLSVKSGRDMTNRVENFYNTVLLRGDYGS